MLTDTEQTNKTDRKLKTGKKPQVNASIVRAYLKENPDFFTKASNKKLLESITIPHYSGCSISLLEYQVQIFRQHKDQACNQLDNIVEINKINQNILTLFLGLVQEMIQCTTLDSLVDTFSGCWKNSLDVDAVSLMFSGTGLHQVLSSTKHHEKNQTQLIDASKVQLPEALRAAAAKQQVHCQLVDEESQTFFSKQVLSGSFAFVPTGEKDQACYIFLGSKNAEKFSPEMQPDMVSFVCNVFSSLLYKQHRRTTEKKDKS